MDETTTTPDADAEMEAMLAEARSDLLFYTQACNPDYIASKFHVFLADKLQKVADGKIKRLIVTCPPRHGKTAMIAIEFPTWLLGKRPETKIVLASYGLDLSMTSSKAARARMASEEYQEIFRTRIEEGDGAAHAWRSTGGGGYKAAGIGSALTGFGADVLLIDDAVRDFADAHSPTVLESTWNWYHSVAYTRLHPGAAVVILMTRWSRSDLVGRLLDPERAKDSDINPDEKWEVVNLPALAEDGDPMGREPGEALFPERYPAERLRSIRASVGSYVWAALYRGDPVVRGGNYIPVSNFIVVDSAPEGLRWVRFWDLAASSKKSADHTASISGAIGPDGVLYLRDLVDGQWEWPEARNRIKMTAVSEKIPIGVEAVAGFKTAFANLIEVLPSGIMCREYGADRDKLTRALPWIAMVEKSKVALVRGEWNMSYILQLEQWTPGKDGKDDMVDATSGVEMMLRTIFSTPVPVNVNDRFRSARESRRRREMIG